MRVTTLLNRLLHLPGINVAGFAFGPEDSLLLSIRRTFRLLKCPHCGHQARGRQSTSVRRWRHLGIWGHEVYLVGEIRRLNCPVHGVVTEAVPWARHDSAFTCMFEDAVALQAQRTNKTAVSKLFDIAWQTVGSIANRVVAEKLDADRFQKLRRIGVDEISFRKRHRYLTVVTDHDKRKVIWVAEGKSSDVIKQFFDHIGPEACQRIEIVIMDMSEAFKKAVKDSLPNAQIVFDHFHIARLANEALNEVRRNLMREASNEEHRAAVKGTRWALLHRKHNATPKHLQVINTLRPGHPLGRAYLLKEMLLDILSLRIREPATELKRWRGWAARSRLPAFVKLGRTIRNNLHGVLALLKERFTNGLAEGINNKIRLLSHQAYGFHSAPPLIGMIYLCCSGITLPHLQLL